MNIENKRVVAELGITSFDDGTVQVAGPVGNFILTMDMLLGAQKAVLNNMILKTQNLPKPSQIVKPNQIVVPKGVMVNPKTIEKRR